LTQEFENPAVEASSTCL